MLLFGTERIFNKVLIVSRDKRDRTNKERESSMIERYRNRSAAREREGGHDTCG